MLKIVGLDPSMSNFGMVEANLCPTSGVLSNVNLFLCENPPEPKNKQVRQNSMDLERARKLYEALTQTVKGADLVFVEIPVGSQSARAMASYGMCIGLLASIDIPLIQVTPSEVKLAGAGTKTATKAEMIQWATNKHPEANWLTAKTKGVTRFVDKNEHLADALAAIYAGMRTDEFKRAKAFFI